MRKSLIIGLFSAALVCLFALPALYAVDVPGDMVLKAPGKMKKAPVAFSHKGGHANLDCKVCHHSGEEGKLDTKSCATAGCHDNMDKKADQSFYKAFHAKDERSCVGCHKKEKKGPTKCTECHPKKK